MNILEELTNLIKKLEIPVETGVFKASAPDTYIVLVPLADTYPLSADDAPTIDYQEVRISLFSKSNYMTLKNIILKKLIEESFYITERKYNGYDTETGYYQYTIDVAKNYLY